MMPARLLGASIALGVILFLAQLSYLSFYVFQNCMAATDAIKDDCYFQIYKQVPSTLPMVTAVSAGLIIAAQIIVRFFHSIPSIEDWPKSVRENPALAFYYVLVYGLSAGTIIAHLIVESNIRLNIGASFAGFVIILHSVMPWLTWVVDTIRLGKLSSSYSNEPGPE